MKNIRHKTFAEILKNLQEDFNNGSLEIPEEQARQIEIEKQEKT